MPDYDARATQEELRRQLDRITRRIDETIALLQDGRPSLVPERAAHIPAAAADQGRGDLFQLCVRLEVALAESAESIENLIVRLRQARENDPAAWPWTADHAAAAGPAAADGALRH